MDSLIFNDAFWTLTALGSLSLTYEQQQLENSSNTSASFVLDTKKITQAWTDMIWRQAFSCLDQITTYRWVCLRHQCRSWSTRCSGQVRGVGAHQLLSFSPLLVESDQRSGLGLHIQLVLHPQTPHKNVWQPLVKVFPSHFRVKGCREHLYGWKKNSVYIST